MRFIDPPLSQLDQLPTPLTAGEQAVLDFFDSVLDSAWEIYIQPHLNGLRPDFVLLHPDRGIGVFEVKDWDISNGRYSWKTARMGSTLWLHTPEGQHVCIEKDNPVKKVHRYKKLILDLYCPSLGMTLEHSPGAMSAVTGGIIFTAASTEAAEALLEPARNELRHLETKEKARRYPVSGRDALQRGSLAVVFPDAIVRSRSKYMSPAVARDLQAWLLEPTVSADQRNPLPLDAQKGHLISRPMPSGNCRLRGPAGSGKSLVIAGRAAALALKRRNVLVLSYNITLWHYLHDLAARHQRTLVLNQNTVRVCRSGINSWATWNHFHGWCRSVLTSMGREQEYLALISGLEGLDKVARTRILERDIPKLVDDSLNASPEDVPDYDAILIDEAQDFQPEWLRIVRRTLRRSGELWIAHDSTQDVYERNVLWTDDSYRQLGLSTPWEELPFSYRLPRKAIERFSAFIDRFLAGRNALPPRVPETRNTDSRHRSVWITCSEDQLDRATARAVIAFLEKGVQPADIVFLAATQTRGLNVARMLEHAGFKVGHIFGEGATTADRFWESRSNKLSFYLGQACVKGCTFESFKGFESRIIVLQLAPADGSDVATRLYVGLTRVLEHERESSLAVVSANLDFEDLAKMFIVRQHPYPKALKGFDRTFPFVT